LTIYHSDQFIKSKDNKAALCLCGKGSVLEHCRITGNLKKIRQVAFLPKTLKRFATCLAPQQLLFNYNNQYKGDLFLRQAILTNGKVVFNI
jgi:hypothetical protein